MTTQLGAITDAYACGAAFAHNLNAIPGEGRFWSKLKISDDLPGGDYLVLRDTWGEVTEHMAAAYRDGFNAIFRPVPKGGYMV